MPELYFSFRNGTNLNRFYFGTNIGLGMSVDLAELGSFRLVVPSKMMDSAAEVTVADALKTPKIVFTPKQKMRDAANSVELSIDRSAVKASTGGGTATTPDEDVTEDPLA